MESDEGLKARGSLIEEINERFDGAISTIMDPGKHERQMRALREDPLMSASVRAMDRMKWDIAAGIDPLAKAGAR